MCRCLWADIESHSGGAERRRFDRIRRHRDVLCVRGEAVGHNHVGWQHNLNTEPRSLREIAENGVDLVRFAQRGAN